MNIVNIENLSDIIANRTDSSSVLLVGMDGLGGAGKSTAAEKLKCRLNERDIGVGILHIDDFINPRAVRYNDAYPQWECYYNLQWRYDYLIDEILAPIKTEGSFSKMIELYDKENDSYLKEAFCTSNGGIVIVEGIFLQRKELSGIFECMVYIDVPEKTRLERVLKRDVYIGSAEDIADKYEKRYFPAERKYLSECDPIGSADYILSI